LGQRCIWTWSSQRKFKIICHRVSGLSREGIFARNSEVNIGPTLVIRVTAERVICRHIICPDIYYTSTNWCEVLQPTPFKSSSALSDPDQFRWIELLECASKRTGSNRNIRKNGRCYLLIASCVQSVSVWRINIINLLPKICC
jgi:hypothetical protein